MEERWGWGRGLAGEMGNGEVGKGGEMEEGEGWWRRVLGGVVDGEG